MLYISEWFFVMFYKKSNSELRKQEVFYIKKES